MSLAKNVTVNINASVGSSWKTLDQKQPRHTEHVHRPAYEGSIGDLYGVPIHDWNDPRVQERLREYHYVPEWFDLAYDEMFPLRDLAAILVGEKAHFEWRMRCAAENEAVRQVARAHIVATYERILGEPYPQ
jgi:hypothetical protein